MTSNFNRRQFFRQSLYSSVSFVSAAWWITGCSPSEKKKEYQLKSCQDLSEVSEVELAKRKQFAYETRASDPLKKCMDCKLFLPPRLDESCGGCSLFKGPVEAEGSCTYWAPLEA